MSRSTFNILFYANKSKEKNGIVPIMGRVTINGTQSQFSCKRSIPLSLWDAKGRSCSLCQAKNCAKDRSREALDLNRDLDNIKAQIIKHYQHLSDRDAFVTAEMVRNSYQGNTREMNRANEQRIQEVTSLKRILEKAYQWFPSFKQFLSMERECLQYGFSEEQMDKLLHGHTINYSGWLHSNEYRRNALADNVSAQVIRDEKRNLFLLINDIPITQWFREQYSNKLEKKSGLHI